MMGCMMETDRIGWTWFAFTKRTTYRQWRGSGAAFSEYENNLEEHQPAKS